MSNESPWVDARKYREAKKASLVKRVRESEKEELAARVAEQDRINAKIRQVRSEYLIADALEEKVLSACNCCSVLTASVGQPEDDCVFTVAYTNPNYAPTIVASGTVTAPGNPLLNFGVIYEPEELSALLASAVPQTKADRKSALKARVDEALTD